jgi:hypothetical protein
MAKAFILLVLLVILGSLGSGLYYMIKDRGQTDRVAKALTWRIGLSLTLFLLLFILFATGIIEPHSAFPGKPAP